MAELTDKERADLDNWFTYHPATPETLEHYNHVRAVTKELVVYMLEKLPNSADRTAAIRSLRRTVMDINLAIACNP